MLQKEQSGSCHVELCLMCRLLAGRFERQWTDFVLQGGSVQILFDREDNVLEA
jgi:hypothetical protein